MLAAFYAPGIHAAIASVFSLACVTFKLLL